MLKNGIKCVGMDADDDSEHSDWGGFNWKYCYYNAVSHCHNYIHDIVLCYLI